MSFEVANASSTCPRAKAGRSRAHDMFNRTLSVVQLNVSIGSLVVKPPAFPCVAPTPEGMLPV